MAARPARIAGEFVLWWLALSAGGSGVLVVVDRVARRLLPLAALLRLSLVFPDEAPSRFRAALQAGKVRRLEDRLRLMEEARGAGTARESAERLLTLVAALSEHDKITRGHSERVRAYAVMIGEGLRLDKPSSTCLNWAALLHDMGKLDVDRRDPAQAGAPERGRVGAAQAATPCSASGSWRRCAGGSVAGPTPSATTTSAGTGRAIRAA